MRIKDKSNYWWVWSPKGPADDGVRFGRQFVNGMLPFPVPGDVASELEYQGFLLKEYEPGEEFSHWEKDEHRFTARFNKPEEKPPIDINDPPEVLPDPFMSIFTMYTAKGKLKKAYRGD